MRATHPDCQLRQSRDGANLCAIVNGKLIIWNRTIYQLAVRDDDTRATFEMIAAPPHDSSLDSLGCHDRLDPRQNLTVGQWADN